MATKLRWPGWPSPNNCIAYITNNERLTSALLRVWLLQLESRVGYQWVVRLMALQLYCSLFGGVSWRTLSAMRRVLRAFWPRQWQMPEAVYTRLHSEPC